MATSKARKEAAPAPTKYVISLLEDMATASTEAKELESRLKVVKTKRDALVKKARDRNVSYNDIAAATGMSISWINAALIRTDGYRPRQGRPRRLTTATDDEL